MSANLARHLVPFDDLPDKRRVWNQPPDSEEEGLGRLILLTPDVVAAAASSCIRTGRRVCLNWSMQKMEMPHFGRHPPQHHIFPIPGGLAFDDTYIFNPQQSSQWDGLRHFSGPGGPGEGAESGPAPGEGDARIYYGGTRASEIQDRSSARIGTQHWAREGICGRGVLLDYAAYAARHGITYSAFSSHAIPLSVLQDIAKEENVSFKRGDIVFVRVGVTKEWEAKSLEEKARYQEQKSPQHAGIEATEEMLRWIWDDGVVAVASDSVSLEVMPPQEEYQRPGGKPPVPGLILHPILLAGWGVPIGELFDLEGLSRLCQDERRWDFFVASVPLNMPGGVSSPPNAVAIF